MKHKTWIPLILLALAFNSQAADLKDLFPQDKMGDVSSLKLKVSKQKNYPSKLWPGRRLKRIDIKFSSFEWAGEEWRHKAFILLPDHRPASYRGAGVILSSHSFRDWALARMAEASALMGIPALVITSGNPGRHYGIANENDLMGFGQKKFLESGEPNWIGYAWLAKVIVRAITASKEIPEMEAERFVVTGCSKRGEASWIAAAVDERIIGAYPTCWNAGNIMALLELKAERWGLDYQPHRDAKTIAPAYISTRQQKKIFSLPRGLQLSSYIDPYSFRSLLKGKMILYACGTNDALFPVGSDTVFIPYMPEGIKAQLIPNTAHTSSTDRHLKAWKMWLAHCFVGRDIPKIRTQIERKGEKAVITTNVESQTEIKEVRVWSSHDKSGAYLHVRWDSKNLEEVAPGIYRGSIHAPAQRFTGFFIEVADDDPGTVTGVTTSGFMEIKGKDS